METAIFRPIKISTLLPHTFPGVPMFLKNDGNYVLYKSHELPFTNKDRDRLFDNNVEYLYIRTGDFYHYNQYVETNLPSLLRNERLDINERKQILCQSTINYVAEVLENTTAIKENIGRGYVLIQSIIEYLLKLEEAMEIMLPLVGHNHYTYVHSVQVVTYSLALHNSMFTLTSEELTDIGIGSLFHDFGKVYVPNEIINKPTKLSDAEFAIMKRHTVDGVGFLQQATSLNSVSLSIVRNHHEKENGWGYPDGLKGHQLHRSSKIAALVDVYSALTTNRPYRLALSKEKALDIMENEMVGSFDENYLSVLKEII
jgi:HD-GYP domain-containing protein (c-di-GMP phosphodiesterase class II)